MPRSNGFSIANDWKSLPDAQGSTRALTNASGVVTDTYRYDAFGALANQTGSTVNSYLYTGQQFDSLTGLYDLRARYYNPADGRFLSQDTAGVNYQNPVELNRYVYTANNPVNASDPSGHNEYGINLKYVAVAAGGGVAVLAGVWAINNSSCSATNTCFNPAELIAKLLRALEPWGRLFDDFSRLITRVITGRGTSTTATGTQTQTQTQRGEPKKCDPDAFREWWDTFPLGGSVRPGVDWYDYEQRVTRGPGTMGGIQPRTIAVLVGANEVMYTLDADGGDPNTCRILDAKHRDFTNPRNPYRRDAFPLYKDLRDELLRAAAIVNDPDTPALGVEIRTNDNDALPYFESVLNEVGLTVGVKGFAEYEQ